MPRSIACQLAGWFFIATIGQAAAEDNLLGAQLAASCAACHRLDGGGTPIIGMQAEALTSMMLAFRLDTQSNQIMHIVSASLSDEEIAALARYLESLKREPGKP